MRTRNRIAGIVIVVALLCIILYFGVNYLNKNYEPYKETEETLEQLQNALRAERIRNAIEAHMLVLGMTKKQVIESLGKPNDIHRSVGSWGVHEQWVYESKYGGSRKYLYFENDTLTSWQD